MDQVMDQVTASLGGASTPNSSWYTPRMELSDLSKVFNTYREALG